jgi:TorA maturation chaperone TorD
MDISTERSSTKDLIKIHQFREMFYLFLSRSFGREVDRTFLHNLFEVSNTLQASLKSVAESKLSRGRELLKSFCIEIRGAKEEAVIGDLARHYAFLFLGVGPETVALCESAYRNEGGLLFQNAYFDILEKYREVGLGKREDFPEPEDHLSLELAYMAHLCRRTIFSIEAGKEGEAKKYCQYQASFLNDHLLPWVPPFAKGLSQISPSAFYKALAYLLEGYLKIDFEFLDSLLPAAAAKKAVSRRKSKGPERREGDKKKLKGKKKHATIGSC